MKTSRKPVAFPGHPTNVSGAGTEDPEGIAYVIARPRSALSWLAPWLAGERSAAWLWLGVPLLLGVGLRLYNLGFGSQVGMLFGDEVVAADQAAKLAAAGLSDGVRPNGALHYLIISPFLYLLSAIRGGAANPRLVYDLPIFDRILVGRLINLGFGAATIAITYFTARRLAGKTAGFWAALVVAVSPSLVVETHFNATAAPLAFWFALMLYFLVSAQEGRRGAGYLALGAAVAAYFTKPVGVVALALVGVWAAWTAAEKMKRGRRMQTAFVAVALIAACGALVALRWHWLLDLARTFLVEYDDGTRPIYAWEWFLRHEGPFLILAVLGVLVSRLDRRLKWPLVIVALLYSLGTLAFRVFFVRWLLLLTPLIALFAGEALANRRRAPLPPLARRLLVPLAITIAVLTTWDAGMLVRNLGSDVREGTWVWVRDRVPAGATLAMPFAWPSDGRMELSYRTVVEPLLDDPDRYIAQGVNYLIVVRRGPDYYNWRAYAQAPDAMETYPALYRSFPRVHTVEGTLLHIPVPATVDVLRVTGTQPYPEDKIIYGALWYPQELQANGEFYRWTAGRGEVIYNWSGDGPAARRLSFPVLNREWNGPLDILVNGVTITQVPATAELRFREVETSITLVPGINRIALVSGRGCTRPVVIDPSDHDTRCLGVFVGPLTLSPGP